MTSFTCIIHYCHFETQAFSPRGGGGGGGDVLLVSRSRMCIPRKLVFCGAKRDSALNGSVHEEHGSVPVDVIDTERPVVPVPASATSKCGTSDAKRLRAVLRVSEPGPSGSLPPHVLYLLELGFDLEQIKVIAGKYPPFANYSLEGRIRPLIEYLLDLGVSKSDLPNLLIRWPPLSGMRLSENLFPSMAFLDTLGVDKSKWAKLIFRCPAVLTYSRKKIEATIQFLYEVGLSEESIGKSLIRCPVIITLSIEDQLQPKVEYFQSLGADVAVLLRNCPQVMGLNLENNLKPVTEFFLENGFSIEEVGTMISNFACLYSYSLKGNLIPKWEFFLTMDYPRQDLLKNTVYFGYSLKKRIKPRYNLMKESGVKFSLGQLLRTNEEDFELLLKKRIEKQQKFQLDESCY